MGNSPRRAVSVAAYPFEIHNTTHLMSFFCRVLDGFQDTLGIATLSPWDCQSLLPAGSNSFSGYYLIFRYRRLVAAISAPPVRRIFGYYIHSASRFVLAPAQTTPPYGETVACLVYLLPGGWLGEPSLSLSCESLWAKPLYLTPL